MFIVEYYLISVPGVPAARGRHSSRQRCRQSQVSSTPTDKVTHLFGEEALSTNFLRGYLAQLKVNENNKQNLLSDQVP